MAMLPAGSRPAFSTTSSSENAASNYSRALAWSTDNGWLVASEGPSGAQLKQPKKLKALDKLCLVAGIALLLLFWPLGIFLIIVAVLDYAFFTKEKTAFISRDNPHAPK